jgi:OOP family OmpA-OmpF porin
MTYKKLAALAALQAILLGGAHASDAGAYAGASLGAMRSGLSSEFKDSLARNFGSVSLSEDQSDAAVRALLGYRFNRNFAVEGGWSDFGSVAGQAGTTLPLARVAAARETTAWFVDAVGVLPVGDSFDLTGRIGVAFWRVEATTTTTLAVSSVSASAMQTQNGSSPRLGIGAQYRISDKVRLALELESFRAGKSGDIGRSTVSTVFAGIKFTF